MKFWSRVFRTKFEIVVAICDEKLLDQELKSKKIKVKIPKKFYGGRLIDETIALKMLKIATIANLWGRNIIKLAEEYGFISRKNVLFVERIPHAQFVKIK